MIPPYSGVKCRAWGNFCFYRVDFSGFFRNFVTEVFIVVVFYFIH